MSGRAIIVLVTGVMIVTSILFFKIAAASTKITENTTQYYRRQTAKNLAQIGVRMALRQVANNLNWRTGFPLTNLLGGKVIVTAKDSTFFGQKVVKIVSIGIVDYGKSLERRDTSTAFVPRGNTNLPSTVKAAITTNNPTSTLGNLIVDGRDHDSIGTGVIAGQGTFGVWTTKTFSQSGNSTVGGTNTSVVDISPAKAPKDSSVVRSNQIYSGGYPGTPDSVLGGPGAGFPEGTLKAIAQSKVAGSQYVTDPTYLTYPLQGVTYVELPAGGKWQAMDISGSGILIVHNNAKDALMKNLNKGTFRGLLIADDIVNIHATIVGAVISLDVSPSAGSTVGNGNGTVLFSRKTLKTAMEQILTPSGDSAGNVLAWWE